MTGLAAWAAKPGPKKVLAAARRRFEQGSAVDDGTIKLDLSDVERQQVGELLGIQWQSSTRAVSVRQLNRAVSDHGLTLRQLVEQHGGEVRNRAEERTAERKVRDDERAQALGVLLAAGFDESAAATVLSRSGLPAAGTGQLRALVDRACMALAYLQEPTDVPLTLAEVAVQRFGDPHALDRSARLGRFTARLVAARFGDGSDPQITDPEQWRNCWRLVGVSCDEVSSLVLVAGLELTGTAPAVRTCNAAANEPVWLTLRSLRGDWQPSSTADVFVCENPAVVEAAASRLSHIPPIVCTYGWPTTAAFTVLDGYQTSGALMHVRADDDASGQSIVATLLGRYASAGPWRYTVRDGSAPETPEYEEHVLDLLLQDLERATASE